MNQNLANFVGFQLGWFACILGAAHGRPWLGPLVVVAWLAPFVWISPRSRGDLATLLAAGLSSYLADSVLVLAGWLSFPSAAWGWPSTLWMVALWVNLAGTLRWSLSWLREHRAWSALLGSLGGPLAYAAGVRLGAVQLPAGAVSLVAVGVVWALAMPALLWLSRVCEAGALPREVKAT
ncbi:DUF2878 domain-containing protein [bacterium]|nr:DUF2878 domain-containing protein [bacterium]